MKPITIEMTYKKSTKNTHVYENTSDLSPIPSLYIKRSGLPVDYPKTIKVVISDE